MNLPPPIRGINISEDLAFDLYNLSQANWDMETSRDIEDLVKQIQQQARNEALEEAALICDKWDEFGDSYENYGHCVDAAEEIRDLGNVSV